LTVVQPPYSSALVVELRRVELAFFVNERNCLESSQLRAEIDPDQDAGTWYVVVSNIVSQILDHYYAFKNMPRERRLIL